MKLLDLIRRLIREYFIIFGILIICTVFLTPPNTIKWYYILLAMVFAAVRFITWRGDLVTARKINEKLKNLKNNVK